MEWITDRMPEEHESIFSKIAKKSGNWQEGMWKTCSGDVLVTIEHKEQRFTSTGITHDGKWVTDYTKIYPDAKVVGWMPFPEPYKG